MVGQAARSSPGSSVAMFAKAIALWSWRHRLLGSLTTVDTTNHLIGLQVGIDMDIPLVSKLSAVGGLKVGGFLNIAEIDSHIFDDDGNSVRFDDTDIRGSAITEGNLGMTWNFTDNMSASLGYMAMLLSWVTSAGENFPQANTAAEFQQHDSDHVLVHGPLARFNVTFN